MAQVKFLLKLLFCTSLVSCKNQDKSQMETSMLTLRNRISLYKHDLEERGGFIQNNGNLSDNRKQELHLDSLIELQQKQEIKMNQLKTKLDSLERIYDQRYKK